MLLRFNDVVIGMVAGAVCAVAAAAFEAGILFFRFFTLGRVGVGFAPEAVVIALGGALFGGLIGLGAGRAFGRSSASRVTR